MFSLDISTVHSLYEGTFNQYTSYSSIAVFLTPILREHFSPMLVKMRLKFLESSYERNILNLPKILVVQLELKSSYARNISVRPMSLWILRLLVSSHARNILGLPVQFGQHGFEILISEEHIGWNMPQLMFQFWNPHARGTNRICGYFFHLTWL